MSISRKFCAMNRTNASDHLRILVQINNFLLRSLPNTYMQTLPIHLDHLDHYGVCDAHKPRYNRPYPQKRHSRKVGKEFRRMNRIHQPGCDVQRRDHQRKR
jgi:hypothetical protein